MRFRPCIDLHNGRVVQIVGGSLRDAVDEAPQTNFATKRSSADYAHLYQADDLPGGHVIALGPGNEEAALMALRAWPGGLQMGGGVNPNNARIYLDAGASHVIVTSYVFGAGTIDMERLQALVDVVGKERLVLDLSCRWRDGDFWIVTDRWQHFTETPVRPETLELLSEHCDEFLVHGVDVEGKMQGIQADLVELLGTHSPIPVTYAGGVRSFDELDQVERLGQGRVDLTIGSALDIFGGQIPYRDVVDWQRSKDANLDK
jgi:phosphoribosylformimino-5-aminoimidazole carboxamide ribotide isomerase